MQHPLPGPGPLAILHRGTTLGLAISSGSVSGCVRQLEGDLSMTVPFWCLLIACLLPYVWGPFSMPERRKQLGSIDNKNPRPQQAQLSGRGARAVAAHKNAFEAIAVFAPAVLVAHLAGADPLWSARWAELFIIARVLHGVFYLGDLDLLRSGMFGVAMVCDAALFILAARATGPA
jgi:uncharacterized MAPEG superfamily protein